MKLEILTVENPVVRQKCNDLEDIDLDIVELADNMFDTIKGCGFGLTANQVGQPIKLCVVHVPAENQRFVMVNPVIRGVDGSVYCREGCLSIPETVRNPVLLVRYSDVRVEYLTLQGTKVTKEYTGLTARVIQHELDHIDGIVITDKEINRTPIRRDKAKVSPNDSCPCGSGKKYKKCCMK